MRRWRSKSEWFERYAFGACEDGARVTRAVRDRHHLKGERERMVAQLLSDLDLHHPPCLALAANQAFDTPAALAYQVLTALKLIELPAEHHASRVRPLIRHLLTLSGKTLAPRPRLGPAALFSGRAADLMTAVARTPRARLNGHRVRHLRATPVATATGGRRAACARSYRIVPTARPPLVVPKQIVRIEAGLAAGDNLLVIYKKRPSVSLTMSSPAPSPVAATKPHAFATVFALLSPHMAELDRFLRGQLASFEPEIRAMADYCIDTSGKRIRPALVFLSGWRGPTEITTDLVRVAAVVELVHLATLVHDDIMDEADVRRSRRTASREYGATSAVLLGDALFAHALHLATQFPTTEICAAVSDSTRKVCAGEIVQTLRRRSTNITRADYQRIVDLKTAELFRVSCFLGARLAGSEPGYVAAASRFGRHLGIAYQIYDDLVDFFGDEMRIGKTLGTDLASGKLTLPLLVLLERLTTDDRASLIAELSGAQPPQLALRLRQMRDLGIFALVAEAVDVEITAAKAALEAWPSYAATPLLLGLCEVLKTQVASLRPPSQ